jgi:hypothetical protein
MRIILTQTQTTFTIDMPDHCTVRPQPVHNPANSRHAKTDSPFSGIADLLGKLQTEMASGRDSKLWTPKEPNHGTPLT